MEETSVAPFSTTGTWKVAPEAGGAGGGLSANAAPVADASVAAAGVVAGGCADAAGETVAAGAERQAACWRLRSGRGSDGLRGCLRSGIGRCRRGLGGRVWASAGGHVGA